MKKIYLDDLPQKGKSIDWKNSIGYQIPFIYNEIQSNLDIIDYNPKNNKVTIQYQNNKINISINHLKEVKIGVVLNKCNHNYKYHVNEIVQIKNSTIKILMQIKIKHGHRIEKGYKYQCLKDKYIGKISECNLVNGCGCPICSNNKIKIGINDMWTTNPELAKLLANPNDGYKYMQQSNKKVDWRCPQCNNIIKNKDISKIYYYGLSCPRCSDGISYPEKFMYNLLKQLEIDFEYQYSPKWCNYKFKGKNKRGRYDFYILSKQIIIEMDGGWHKEDNNLSGQTKEESKQIDQQKDELAFKHNIEVIRIDCDYYIINDKFNNIKNNILNSKLIQSINLSNINWIEIDKQSQKSLIKQICNVYKNNPDIDITQISKMFKLHKNTIMRYLKLGNKYDLCKYNVTIISKKVICIETQKTYPSTCQAAYLTSVCQTSICNCCNRKLKSAGGYHWMYYEDYLKTRKDDKTED